MTAPALSLVPPPPEILGDEAIERAVLSCCLHDQHYESMVDAVIAAGVTPEWFSSRPREEAMRAIISLHERGERIDLLSLRSVLAGVDATAWAEAAYAYTDLPDAYQIEIYIGRLRELVERRRVYDIGILATSRCVDGEISGLIADLRSRIDRIESGLHAGTGVTSVAEATAPVVAGLDRDADEILGVPTGFADIDALLLGLERGKLYLVGARPRVGKTALALNIAANVARGGNGALFATLEMNDYELGERLLAAEPPVDYRALRTANLAPLDKREVRETADQIAAWPLHFFDRPGIGIAELQSQCRWVARKCTLVLVVVDYLQLMRGRGTNREQEVAAVARGLKELAKTEGVAVLALAQLSREPDKRGGESRPGLSDLRESGELEQAADVVAFLYRAELQNPHDVAARGTAEFIVAKNRSGEARTVDLRWEGRYQRFRSVARPHQQEQFRQFGGAR